MGTAAEVSPPALDERAIRVEDDDGVRRFAGLVDGVAKDDAAIGGDDDAAGVAEFKGVGWLEEVVESFVVVGAGAHAGGWGPPLGGW